MASHAAVVTTELRGVDTGARCGRAIGDGAAAGIVDLGEDGGGGGGVGVGGGGGGAMRDRHGPYSAPSMASSGSGAVHGSLCGGFDGIRGNAAAVVPPSMASSAFGMAGAQLNVGSWESGSSSTSSGWALSSTMGVLGAGPCLAPGTSFLALMASVAPAAGFQHTSLLVLEVRESGKCIVSVSRIQIVAKQVSRHSDFGPSPFELGLSHEEPSKQKVCNFARKLRHITFTKERPWYIHDMPSLLQISAKRLSQQFTSDSDLDYKVVDAVMRLYTLLDDELYIDVHANRWRHFLGASWAIDVLRGGELIQSKEIRDMFIGSHLRYEVEDCRMIIAPVIIDWDWHLYVWDFDLHTVIVIDPTIGQSFEEQIELKHAQYVVKLHDGLFDCKNTFFRGWNVSRKRWSIKYMSFNTPDVTLRTVHTALCSALRWSDTKKYPEHCKWI
ncbi:hypothetical protein ACP70R_017338 [Stipagrostis hirtigluma subsp. patula]